MRFFVLFFFFFKLVFSRGKRGFLAKFYQYLIYFCSKFHETPWLYCLLQVSPCALVFLFMIDLYKDNHVCACVNFFFKNLLRNYRLDFYQISQECSLDRGQKLLFTITEKSSLLSDTGFQAPLVQFEVLSWKQGAYCKILISYNISFSFCQNLKKFQHVSLFSLIYPFSKLIFCHGKMESV